MPIKLNAIVVLWLFLISYTIESVADNKPKLQCDAVVFKNTKIINIKSDNICANNDEFILVESWKRAVIVRIMPLQEDSVKYIEVYDYDGNILNKSENFIGDVLILEASNKIILASMSAHFSVDDGYLLNRDGAMLKRYGQPKNVFEIKKSEDDKLIWYLSQHIRDGKPYVRLSLLNSEADVLLVKEFYSAETYVTKYDDKEYKILIPEPQLPG